ncbi:MAG: phage holin family protein [Candidatus Roizmanbacteria bacterium]|nr:phage holin family protein [Candidatus Roizmanbacteria bacterium]
MNFLLNLLISGIAVFITAYVLPGVDIQQDVVTILMVVVLLGVSNAVIKPILHILTFPITIVTFGLFAIVINALMVVLVDYLVEGFTVDNFWWALAFSIVLSIVSSVLRKIGE